MIEYRCSKCSKLFRDRCDYNRHLNRKKPCKIKNINETKIDANSNDSVSKKSKNNPKESLMNPKESKKNNNKKYQCEYCDRKFTTNSNMNKHIKNNCKIKKTETTYDKLLKKIEEQNKEIEKLKKRTKSINKNNNNTITNNNNITTNNNIINTTNNIKLVAFGEEDLAVPAAHPELGAVDSVCRER